jgi:hypothetical protein
MVSVEGLKIRIAQVIDQAEVLPGRGSVGDIYHNGEDGN